MAAHILHHDCENKPNIASQQILFGQLVKKMKQGSKCISALDSATAAELHDFARANTAAVGVVLSEIMRQLVPDLMTNGAFQIENCWITCSITLSNVIVLEKMHTYGDTHSVNRMSASGATISKSEYSKQHKIYGVSADMNVAWTFESSDGNNTNQVSFDEKMKIEPKPSQLTPIALIVPKPTQFFIGSALDLCHNEYIVGIDNLKGGWDTNDATQKSFPRHNPVVAKIEEGLNEFCKMVDFLAGFIAPFSPDAVDVKGSVFIPWAPHTWKEDGTVNATTATDVATDMDDGGSVGQTVLTGRHILMLRVFHNERKDEMVDIGQVSNMLQELHVLKLSASYFAECYAAIDEIMVRSFLSGIGPEHSKLFTNGLELDYLVSNIGLHQAECANIKLFPCIVKNPGFSIEAMVRYPGQVIFSPLMASRHVNNDYHGELFVDGPGSEAIKTRGKSERLIATLSTRFDECGGTKKPEIIIKGTSGFRSCPVAVAVGTPNGASTMAGAIFLFSGGLNLRMVIETAQIPSNKAFGASMSRLPKEMADLASAIRMYDLGLSGVSIEVFNLLPILAHAIGRPKHDLEGDGRMLEDLLNLMRAGCSIMSLNQNMDTTDGFTDVGRTSTLDDIKARIQELKEDVLAQGAIDDPEPVEAPLPQQTRGGDTFNPAGCYRSLGASAGDDEPTFQSLSVEDAPMDSGDDAPEDAPVAKSNDDKGFMNKIMDKLSDDPAIDDATYSGCKLHQPNIKSALKFASTTFRRKWTLQCILPEEKEFKSDPGLDQSGRNLVELFQFYNAPIETHRLTLFAVFTHVEKNLLTGLMSGSRDPTKQHFEVIQSLADLQKP